MRNLKLIFLALLVSMGFIKSNDQVIHPSELGEKLTEGGPIGHSECT